MIQKRRKEKIRRKKNWRNEKKIKKFIKEIISLLVSRTIELKYLIVLPDENDKYSIYDWVVGCMAVVLLLIKFNDTYIKKKLFCFTLWI